MGRCGWDLRVPGRNVLVHTGPGVRYFGIIRSRVARARAVRLVPLGGAARAAEAERGRLVSRVVPDEQLLDSACGLAREIADNTSAVSVAATRALLWSMLGAEGPWTAHRLDSRAIYELGAGPDAAEGVTAFLEKRPAEFPGRVSTDLPDFLPEWPPGSG